MKEFGRKTIHVLGGLVVLLAIALLGTGTFAALSIPLLLIGLVSVQFEIQKFQLPVFSTVFMLFERKEVIPGKGAIWYWISVMIAVSFFSHPLTELAIVCLTIGDGFATIAGRLGKLKNPLNQKKTVEGTLWFIASSLVAFSFFGEITIVSFEFVLCAAVLESLNLYIDDNLRITLLGFVFMFAF